MKKTGMLGLLISLLLSAIGSYANCTSRPSGLVSWWDGDGNTTDIIGTNSATMTAGPSVSFVEGKVGSAFRFDGDDFLTIGNSADLNMTNAITIEGWINVTNLAEGQTAAILTKWAQSDTLDAYGLYLVKQDGVIHALGMIGTPGVNDSGASGGDIQAGQWNHVAMTYDSTTGQQLIFVNGVTVVSNIYPGGILSSDARVMIGREDSNTPRYFSGLLDEISIYNRALSPGEITAIYDAAADGKCKGDLPQIDLVMTQRLSTNVVFVGSNLVWSVTVTNQGNRTATGVAISVSFPTSVGEVSDLSADRPWLGTGQTECSFETPMVCRTTGFTFTIGTLTNGEAATASITLNFQTNGNFSLPASVAAREVDPILADNSGSVAVMARYPGVVGNVKLQIDFHSGWYQLFWRDSLRQGLIVEETETPEKPDSWRDAAGEVLRTGDDNYFGNLPFGIPADGTKKFFRLRKP